MNRISLFVVLCLPIVVHSAPEACLCFYKYVETPEFSPAAAGSRSILWLSKPLITFTLPAQITLENRMVASVNGRVPRCSVSDLSYFTIPLSKQDLDKLTSVVPPDKTTSLAVVLDGFVIGLTPYTRDWKKWGCGAAFWPQPYNSEEVKHLQAANVKVIDRVTLSFKDWEQNKKRPSEGGTLEDIVCRGKADNPLQSQVNPLQRIVFNREPVQAALSFKNIGIDQSTFKVALHMPGLLAANLKAVSSKVLTADPHHNTPPWGEDRGWLQEGESMTLDANLTRVLGCEYGQTGSGPLTLQYRLGISIPFGEDGEHNDNAWLDLPAPEVTVVAFAEGQFKELSRATVTGAFDTVRLGTHPLEGKPVTLAVYSKAGAVGRILRLDPNADTGTWEMAWDATAQQLHLLGRGLRTRYWLTAPDQLGWEVRMDAGKDTRLETTEGKVRRVE